MTDTTPSRVVDGAQAAETPMSDHVESFWRYLETEHVHVLINLRRDVGSHPYWDSASFSDDVAKALVADRKALLAARPHRSPIPEIDGLIRFQNEMARFLEATAHAKNEDMAFWANVYNAQNCRKTAEALAKLLAHISALEERLVRAREVLAGAVRDIDDLPVGDGGTVCWGAVANIASKLQKEISNDEA